VNQPLASASQHPGAIGAWVAAMRLRTLPAGAVPVLVGSAAAWRSGDFSWSVGAAALGIALLMQIAANFTNDVVDFEKGADTAARLGPTRAVAAGWISPSAMRVGLMVVVGLALALGGWLWSVRGPVVPVLAIFVVLGALAYSAGPFPLAWLGLGEVAVLVFFGLVAVGGTVWLQLGWVPAWIWGLSLPSALLACALLAVNNLRDLPTDAQVGKRTLAVRFGPNFAVAEYRALVATAVLLPVGLAIGARFGALGGYGLALPLLATPLAWRLGRQVAVAQGRAFNQVLAGTARLLLIHGLLLCAGLLLP
jgi:1,4-dihydroxy-2-naphthoate octaprenyltransferase